MKNLLKVVLVFAVAAGLTACHKNVKDDANADLAAGATGAETEMVLDENDVEIMANVPAQEVALGVIHFALDKATLTPESRAIVEANAKAIKNAASSVGQYAVTVEGNCDERGTIAYNIALGQKRAEEVKAYYVRLGIPADKINTVSYGKEKPICYEANEKCWVQNRRAETLLQVK